MIKLKEIFYRKWFLNLYFKKYFHFKSLKTDIDVSFIVCDDYGWILDGICKEIVTNLDKHVKYFKSNLLNKIPSSKNYFITHYTALYPFYCTNKDAFKRNVFVLYTHDYYEDLNQRKRSLFCMNMCKKIFCMNSNTKRKLITEGISKDKILTVYGGADPTLIKTKNRKSKIIGIISNCNERKNPQLISSIVSDLDNQNFKVVGKGWKEILKRFNNVVIHNHDYENINNIYSDIDVFLSASTIEGGPIPLIEAMFSNAVPVVSNTGFCSDIIKHEQNGYLFETNSSKGEIISLLQRALNHKGDIRKYAEHLTWQNFSQKIINEFEY